MVNDNEAPTIIIIGSEIEECKISSFQDRKVEIIKVPNSAIQIDELLYLLAEKNITTLYVEGGQTVHASFLKSRNVHRLITYIAPKIIGGSDASSMISNLSVNMMDEAKWSSLGMTSK